MNIAVVLGIMLFFSLVIFVMTFVAKVADDLLVSIGVQVGFGLLVLGCTLGLVYLIRSTKRIYNGMRNRLGPDDVDAFPAVRARRAAGYNFGAAPPTS